MSSTYMDNLINNFRADFTADEWENFTEGVSGDDLGKVVRERVLNSRVTELNVDIQGCNDAGLEAAEDYNNKIGLEAESYNLENRMSKTDAKLDLLNSGKDKDFKKYIKESSNTYDEMLANYIESIGGIENFKSMDDLNARLEGLGDNDVDKELREKYENQKEELAELYEHYAEEQTVNQESINEINSEMAVKNAELELINAIQNNKDASEIERLENSYNNYKIAHDVNYGTPEEKAAAKALSKELHPELHEGKTEENEATAEEIEVKAEAEDKTEEVKELTDEEKKAYIEDTERRMEENGGGLKANSAADTKANQERMVNYEKYKSDLGIDDKSEGKSEEKPVNPYEKPADFEGTDEEYRDKVNKDTAQAVIRGDYGNGADRIAALEAAGYNYADVQSCVNDQMAKYKAEAQAKAETVAQTTTTEDVEITGTARELEIDGMAAENDDEMIKLQRNPSADTVEKEDTDEILEEDEVIEDDPEEIFDDESKTTVDDSKSKKKKGKTKDTSPKENDGKDTPTVQGNLPTYYGFNAGYSGKTINAYLPNDYGSSFNPYNNPGEVNNFDIKVNEGTVGLKLDVPTNPLGINDPKYQSSANNLTTTEGNYEGGSITGENIKKGMSIKSNNSGAAKFKDDELNALTNDINFDKGSNERQMDE